MSRERGPPHLSGGFTLLELLIAVSLLLLIATMIFGSFSFGRRAWELHERIDEAGSIEAARTFLRREIEASLTRKSRVPARVFFAGRHSSLELTTVVPGRTTEGGLYTYRFAAERDEAGRAVTRSFEVVQRPFRREGEDGVVSGRSEYRRVLLRKVADVRFRYFGRPDIDSAADWHDDWPSQSELPMLVEIAVSFPEQDPRQWPDFLIGLRLSARP